MLEDVDEVMETMRIDEEPPIKTFVEFESATDFKGSEALYNIILLSSYDQLLRYDVQTEAEYMYDEQ